jgi:hypothetical protein
MQRPVLILTLGLWIGCGWARAGEPRQLSLKWTELGARIADKKVAFVLPDGTHVEGKVIDVEQDGLRLKVAKTSNRRTQPKGTHLVARQAISVLRVREDGTKGRWLGTLGAIAVAAGIAAASYPDLYEGPMVIIVPAVVAGGIAGAGVGGYYAGKAFDKKVTEIRIVPDSGAAALSGLR